MATIKQLLGEAYKEDMTLADIEKALENKNLADLSSGKYVSADKFAEAERARDDYKKKYTDKLSDEEKTQQAIAEREAYYKGIEKENAVYKYKAKLGATIKDEATLNAIAEKYAAGDIEGALAQQSEYIVKTQSEAEATLRAELLKKQPSPNPQPTDKTMTKEQYRSLSLAEKQKLATEDRETYDKFNS